MEHDYTVDAMTGPQCDPTMLSGEFMITMGRQGVKDYRIREAKLAVQELLEFVQRNKFEALVARCIYAFLKIVFTTVSLRVR
jgi:hypothetical protein